MSEALIRQKLEGNLQAGSLAQLVKERIGERDTWFLLDTSGSMYETTGGGSQTRKIDALRRLISGLRESITCPMLQFNSACSVVIDGRIEEPTGGTNLTLAIQKGHQRGARHLILISDGIPNDQRSALDAARVFGGPIDVFYVGRPAPHDDGGEAFLQRLAAASGGRAQTISLAQTKQLTSAIRGLLNAAP